MMLSSSAPTKNLGGAATRAHTHVTAAWLASRGSQPARPTPTWLRDCTSTGSRLLARPCGRCSGTCLRAHNVFDEMKGQ